MRQRLSMLVASALAMASPMFAQFNFTNFSGADGSLLLNGSAAIVGTALRLVPASSFVAGSAYYYQKQHLSLSGGWTTTFQFRITNPTNGGADGFSFIIQDAGANALGSTGGNIGYTGIPRSLAVEFDTWQNTEIDEPNGNHVAVHTRWQQPNSSDDVDARLGWANPGFDLEDGQVHTATITYNGSGQLHPYRERGVADQDGATLHDRARRRAYRGGEQSAGQVQHAAALSVLRLQARAARLF